MNILTIIAVCLLAALCSAEGGCREKNALSKHPTDCRRFMACDDYNILHVFDCPAGLVFNPESKECDYAANVPSCANIADLCAVNPCPAATKCVVNADKSSYACLRVNVTNACQANPCKSTQRCVNTVVMPDGYICLNKRNDPCSPNPCPRGDVCSLSSSAASGYICRRKGGNPCFSNPCPRGNDCSLSSTAISGYVCTPKRRDPCNPNPCQNSGTCQLDFGSFRCICRRGYYGEYCEKYRL